MEINEMFFTLHSNVLSRRESFGGIATRIDNGGLYYLNSIGIDIFEAIEDNLLSLDEICKILHNFYDIEKNILKKDVIKFLKTTSQFIKQSTRRQNNPNLDEIVNKIMKNKEYSDNFKEYPCSPIELDIYPTYRCPLDCDFCYVKHLKDNDRTMDKKLFKKVVEISEKRKIFSISILGGEPLISSDIIKQICGDLGQKKIMFNIVTSGALPIEPDIIKKIRNKKNVHFGISIHSSIPSVHDRIVGKNKAFETAIGTLKRLIKNNIKPFVQCVATKDNINHIYEYIHYFQSFQIDGISISYPFPRPGMTIDEYKAIAPNPIKFAKIKNDILSRNFSFPILITGGYSFALQKTSVKTATPIERGIFNCEGGWSSLEISPSGNVFPCSLTLENKEFLLGNVNTDDFSKIWSSPLLDMFRSRPFKKDKPCIGCIHYKYCKGGCFMSSQILFGDYNSPNPMCPKTWMLYGWE